MIYPFSKRTRGIGRKPIGNPFIDRSKYKTTKAAFARIFHGCLLDAKGPDYFIHTLYFVNRNEYSTNIYPLSNMLSTGLLPIKATFYVFTGDRSYYVVCYVVLCLYGIGCVFCDIHGWLGDLVTW